MSFTTDLSKFKKKAMQDYSKVRRTAAISLFSSVVMETPVDKGVLRNNWFASIGNVSSETTTEVDTQGNETIKRIENAIKGEKLTDPIFLTNNLPYAATIEYDGHSQQAPQGMVRINAARWDEIVKEAIKKVQYGI